MAKAEFFTQVALVNRIISQYPDTLFRSDLGGIRLTPGLAKQARSLQQGRAWPDLFIAEPRQKEVIVEHGEVILINFFGLFIEVKDENIDLYQKRNPSKWATAHIAEQAEMLEKLRKKGYYATFGCGFEKCWSIIESYMSLPEIL